MAEEYTWVALMHTKRPDVTGSPFDDERFPLHVAFLRRMLEEGLLVAAGPLGDVLGEGMAVLRLPGADRVEEARRLAESDESVVRGLFEVRVRPWNVVMTRM